MKDGVSDSKSREESRWWLSCDLREKALVEASKLRRSEGKRTGNYDRFH